MNKLLLYTVLLYTVSFYEYLLYGVQLIYRENIALGYSRLP